MVQRAASAASHLQGPALITTQLDHLLSLVRPCYRSRHGPRCVCRRRHEIVTKARRAPARTRASSAQGASATVDRVPPAPDVAPALATVTAALRDGEDRPGQRAMADAVARAIDAGRHLVVGAGTGTGKSLAYLVPAVLSGRTVVVATATKALQDQLATKDLPLVAGALGATHPFRFAVLKGRSNYLCRQRSPGPCPPPARRHRAPRRARRSPRRRRRARRARPPW